jgi:hypothetical protein
VRRPRPTGSLPAGLTGRPRQLRRPVG